MKASLGRLTFCIIDIKKLSLGPGTSDRLAPVIGGGRRRENLSVGPGTGDRF